MVTETEGIQGCLKKVFELLQDNKNSLLNLVIFFGTFGVEEAIRKIAFECPCSKTELYGYSIFVAPIIILLILGHLVQIKLWRICQGCCNREKKTRPPRCLYCGIFIRSCIAPVAWIFFALMDGSYYVCFMMKNPCEASPSKSEEVARLKAVSQAIGILFFMGILSLMFVVLLFSHCCAKMTYEQEMFLRQYRDVEREELEKQLQKKASSLAKDNVLRFLNEKKPFEKPSEAKVVWDEVTAIPKADSVCAVDQKQDMYSYLRLWLQKVDGEMQPLA